MICFQSRAWVCYTWPQRPSAWPCAQRRCALPSLHEASSLGHAVRPPYTFRTPAPHTHPAHCCKQHGQLLQPGVVLARLPCRCALPLLLSLLTLVCVQAVVSLLPGLDVHPSPARAHVLVLGPAAQGGGTAASSSQLCTPPLLMHCHVCL